MLYSENRDPHFYDDGQAIFLLSSPKRLPHYATAKRIRARNKKRVQERKKQGIRKGLAFRVCRKMFGACCKVLVELRSQYNLVNLLLEAQSFHLPNIPHCSPEHL